MELFGFPLEWLIPEIPASSKCGLPPPYPMVRALSPAGQQQGADQLLKAELVAGLSTIHQAMAPWE